MYVFRTVNSLRTPFWMVLLSLENTDGLSEEEEESPPPPSFSVFDPLRT